MLPLYSLTIFLGAALLFLVEPMAARMALPRLGGTPAVWNTCMMFFQAALLAGYALAHVTSRWLTPRRQAAVQIALVLAPLLTLPIAVRGLPTGGASPILWLTTALAAGVGLPFLVASTAAPVLQRWYATTGREPWFLYAASNGGSLLALLCYPVLIEPHLGLSAQARTWSWGYAAFAAATIACSIALWTRPDTAPETLRTEPAPRGTRRQRVLWLALAFAPSSLTLGATQYLSTDIAAVPLLWVVPLSLYLLAFIIAFARPVSPRTVRVLNRVVPVAAVSLAVAFLIEARHPVSVIIALHLLTLFTAALLCHARLALTRPPPARLTEFYLWIAAGGALGGLFNALIAPAIFNNVYEYPLALVLALLLRPRQASKWDGLPRWALLIGDAAIPLLVGGLALALKDKLHASSDTLRLTLTIGIPAALCYLLASRPVGFALGIAGLLSMAYFQQKDGTRLLRERSFFGVCTVSQSFTDDGKPLFHTLTHGMTVHGLQYAAPGEFQKIPLGYYHPDGPIGAVFKAFAGPRLDHVALVGLGTGALAAYGRPGQRMTFHEIDPAVVKMATDPRYFTYLRDCQAQWDTAIGDGLLTLAAAPDAEYGLIVLDAFSSDAIPVHLLTRDAVETYLRKLRPQGLLAFHISNRYVDLEPVLGNIAESLHLAAVSRYDEVSDEVMYTSGRYSCDWVVMARAKEDLGPLNVLTKWLRLRPNPRLRLWTGDYSNIWSVFRWD